MSWSPSKARSLPALRPDQSSPTAALRGRPTALQPPQLRSSHRAPYSRHLKAKPENQRQRKPMPGGTQSYYLPSAAVTKQNEVSFTSDEAGNTRPSKAPKLQSKSQEDDFVILSPTTTPGQAASGSAPITSQPFFSLTEQELKQLRASMGKGPGYKNFRNLTIARSLDSLGRGWQGFVRAKNEAEQDDTIDQFWHHISPELDTIFSTTRFPVGALSLEIAASAAQSNYTESVGRLQPEHEAEIQRLRLRFRSSSLPNTGLSGSGSSSCVSAIAHATSHSTVVPETEPRLQQRGSPEPILYSRPKRVLERPNYRELPPLESSPEPVSSPELSVRTTSLHVTPREIYDSINVQPKFIQFPCEWKGCKANLNNLETLRKHVRIVHWQAQGAQGALCCRWGVCGTGSPTTFVSSEDLENHSVTAHFAPLEWHLGDGHKCNMIVAKASRG